MSKRMSQVCLAEEHLLNLIRKLPPGVRKLPSEEELCRQLDVSRATLREALGQLARAGFITKRHGVGNMVNLSVLNTPMRFDEEFSMRRLLKSAGEAGTRRFAPVPEAKEAAAFIERMTSGTGGAEIKRPWLIQESQHFINGRPSVWTFNFYPDTGVRLKEEDIQGLSFRELVTAVTGAELSHTIKAFIPVSADRSLAEFFGIAEKNPLLMWYLRNFGMDDGLLSAGVTLFNPKTVTLNSFNRWE